MSEPDVNPQAKVSWLSKRWSSARSYFGAQGSHERLPSDDEDPAFPGPSQSAPSITPQVPPSTPVSIAPGSSAGSSHDESPQTETAAFLAEDRQSSSYMASPASGSRDMPRVGSLQRVIDALMRRNAGESSDPDDEEANGARQPQGSVGLQRTTSPLSSHDLPVCLICLEPLTSTDFESGEAMSLECECRGDMGLRHKTCASKWVDVKGDLICDICHTPINNLPPPLPRSENGEDGAEEASSGRVVGATDVFDCIRMTWVVTIVCILFFEFNITRALLTGMVVAVLYTFSCQLMRCLYTRTYDGSNHTVVLQNPNLVNAGPIIV